MGDSSRKDNSVKSTIMRTGAKELLTVIFRFICIHTSTFISLSGMYVCAVISLCQLQLRWS